MTEPPRNTILAGDALEQLRRLPSSCVDSMISSPPWFGHRNYGEVRQMGLEETVDQWVEHLRPVMAEAYRVLTPTASCWIDIGDSYARSPRTGVPSKSLHLAPERLALALVGDSWLVRNRLIWHKANAMPEGVTDRLSNTYDTVLHLTKQKRYFYDLDSIRPQDAASGLLSKNPGDVWTLPIAHYKGAHFATFPERLVERPLLATCPLRVCTACDRPWRRQPGKTFVIGHRGPAGPDPLVRRYVKSWRTLRQPGPLVADCECQVPARPGLVLDPFFGTGTVGVVAERHGRDWLGIELSRTYVELAWQRLGREGPPVEAAA